MGPTRELVTSSGTLNPAGVVYRDRASPAAYVQELPAGAGTSAVYLLNSDAIDATGNGNDGMLVGAPSFAAGPDPSQLAITLDGVHDYVQLPANLGRSSSLTFGGWVNWNGGANWQRIFDLGDGPTRNLFLTPSSGSATLRFAITTTGTSGEQRLEAPALTPGVWTHVAVTIDGTTSSLYVNGSLVATTDTITISPAAVPTRHNYLGKSQYAADPLFAGRLEHVFFTDHPMTDDEIASIAVAFDGETPAARLRKEHKEHSVRVGEGGRFRSGEIYAGHAPQLLRANHQIPERLELLPANRVEEVLWLEHAAGTPAM